ncbi:MAG: Rieske 2Fe-2S domain-containing protein [Pseudonocardiaceae bacterium]|nr:Rieske 2Fe-2S domain-containing protein [Pseudonocardiaceae bacterium]
MTVVDVGPVDDFPDRTMKLVEANGVEIGVCRWGSEIFALRSQCPHQAAPLCHGFLQTALSSRFTPDGVEVDAHAEEPVILCPWHRWEFSLRSGTSFWPGYRARTYPVDVAGGRVLIQLRRA